MAAMWQAQHARQQVSRRVCYKFGPVKDLTAHSIGKHILQMAAPITAGMLFQTLYFLIDLYFVAHLGDAAIAGVGAAGNIMFIVFALTQVLGVGTVALISHAAGRKDQADATRVFNQSFRSRPSAGVLTLLAGYLARGALHAHFRCGCCDDRARASTTCAGSCRVSRCNLRWWPWVPRCAAPESCNRA